MEDTYGCNLINTKRDGRQVTEFVGGYHVHILVQYAGTEREVAYYADILCITPKYLSQVSRTITRLSASQWIQFYASFELVSLLNDTTNTLTEVSDLMLFENVSHFSRYVKKTLGKSPSEYRKSNLL